MTARYRVYRAQCATFQIAREITGDSREVTTVDEALNPRPPFCLHVTPAYRTPETQAFRDLVAKEARRRRSSR